MGSSTPAKKKRAMGSERVGGAAGYENRRHFIMIASRRCGQTGIGSNQRAPPRAVYLYFVATIHADCEKISITGIISPLYRTAHS